MWRAPVSSGGYSVLCDFEIEGKRAYWYAPPQKGGAPCPTAVVPTKSPASARLPGIPPPRGRAEGRGARGFCIAGGGRRHSVADADRVPKRGDPLAPVGGRRPGPGQVPVARLQDRRPHRAPGRSRHRGAARHSAQGRQPLGDSGLEARDPSRLPARAVASPSGARGHQEPADSRLAALLRQRRPAGWGRTAHDREAAGAQQGSDNRPAMPTLPTIPSSPPPTALRPESPKWPGTVACSRILPCFSKMMSQLYEASLVMLPPQAEDARRGMQLRGRWVPARPRSNSTRSTGRP